MIVPRIFLGRGLRFETLDALDGVDHVTTLGWRLIDDSDPWTRRFNRFKVDRATESAILAVRHFVGEIGELERLRFRADSRRAVMALLPHNLKALPKDNKLWMLGNTIANALDAEWLPNVLTQTPHAKLRSIRDASERDAEIRGKYNCKKVKGLSAVLLVDDFVTRGSTMSDAARATRKANPQVKKISGFALGKNERRAYAAEFGIKIHNNHIPKSIAVAWDSNG